MHYSIIFYNNMIFYIVGIKFIIVSIKRLRNSILVMILKLVVNNNAIIIISCKKNHSVIIHVVDNTKFIG